MTPAASGTVSLLIGSLVALILLIAGNLAENSSSAEPYSLRLMGGPSRCEGEVVLQRSDLDWTPVVLSPVTIEFGSRVCTELDCGTALSVESKTGPERKVVTVCHDCKTSLIHCSSAGTSPSYNSLHVKCSESVRLVSGSSLCSGSVQIWDGSWTGVCDVDMDQRGAEVLCRELSCGAPSLLQGALSPLGQTFHCEGHESALMDCLRFNSRTCSSGAAVNLTCSEPLRLVGGASRCAGIEEVKIRGEWRRVIKAYDPWDLEATAAVCRDLDCGSGQESQVWELPSPVWEATSDCVKKFAVRECVWSSNTSTNSVLMVVCSESVRLVSGSGLCSGSVQIWDGSWTGVCDGDLDQRGAEVLCRELGCRAPSLLQGALSPLGQMFHCEGHESALMDCPRSNSRTCSSGATVNLTCSEPLRLVGGASRCAGIVELRLAGEWRRVDGLWVLRDLELAAVCRDLDCGSAVYEGKRHEFPLSPVWGVTSDCVKESVVRQCPFSSLYSELGVEVVCSDLLNRPIISVSVSDGASELQPQGVRVQLGSKFRVRCSVEPQYPGGSFQLLSPTENHTLLAVNHSAHFLFSDTDHTHKGNYTCVYLLKVFNHSFSSQSPSLQLSVGGMCDKYNPKPQSHADKWCVSATRWECWVTAGEGRLMPLIGPRH
ncbi:scavenger receptor cysteine-rich type 1 protein M130-like [Boleophthalmus pectinirostris]|uniref:scavenger receptor cysteine-rich type 1 protein M130-like n=1 Tax=Boleophthalmus pectinirostris TaxID=150288 RepID=UPI0024326073|nr:scavenger receptor cysteine-rich type 1 protein M130-like [Boleophthalmus pectinirostris]